MVENTVEHTNRMLAVGMLERVPVIARREAREVVEETNRAENLRAIRRNRNRGLALVVTLMFEMLVPLVVTTFSLPLVILKYEVLIITMPDALITAYAYLRRY